MTRPKRTPQIVNVVMASKLSVGIPLASLASESEDSEYNPETFSGLICRSPSLGATVNAFSSGKVVSVGARSVRAAVRALEAFKVIVDRLLDHRSSWIEPFTVVNVVAFFDLGESINLEKLTQENPRATYEPELFPGAILRSSGGLAVLVYASGRIVVAGAHSRREAILAIRDFPPGRKPGRRGRP